MPALDDACHADAEDLRVLREALGPARRGPLHAAEMRAAHDRARMRRFTLGAARQRIAAARTIARPGVFVAPNG